MYPKLVTDLKAVKENATYVSKQLKKENMTVSAVTKVFMADEKIAKVLVESNIDFLADSRIGNLKKLKNIPVEKWLIRMPMECEIADTISYADTSLNTSIFTIDLLNKEAKKQNKVHKVILMVDLGDLREGYFEKKELFSDVKQILKMENILLYGIGTNLTCYGGVLPTIENLSNLVEIKKEVEDKFNINIEIVSGGNSSTYTLIDEGKKLDGINNLRLGEVIVLGREASYLKDIKALRQDAFKLYAQIIEIKDKPSVPIGKINKDAFGNTPTFEDKGIITRAILALGRQDIDLKGLIPTDENITVLGGSSDHTILEIRNTDKYKVGSIVEFRLRYPALLQAMNSSDVKKEYR